MEFLPFLDRFDPKILSGEKTCTARNKAYGKPGDVLQTRVGRVLLLEVLKLPLGVIRDQWWPKEGVKGPHEFEVIWCQIHPSGFDPKALKYLHVFRLLKEGEELNPWTQ